MLGIVFSTDDGVDVILDTTDNTPNLVVFFARFAEEEFELGVVGV